ncbi:DNA-processing protein DprA [Thiotrichales bacterium 19S3-7]|nr:DNA-processing protein DprA [Thiotrichales bacterium 19S3-7]MCF6801428.1 DNA-processing protein DprA [Thiotrichales bacterium 19S3-11]
MTSQEILSNEQALWIILEQIKGIGIKLALKIIKNTPSLVEFFNRIDHYQKFINLPYETYLELKKCISKEQIKYYQQVKKWLEASESHHVLTFKSPHYPELLRQTHSPPPILYVKGSLEAISMPQIAIVGTRKASTYGLKNAFSFAKGLASEHYGITSGLAIGIDTQAHLGALDAFGKTIAVLGTGLNYIYPRNNQFLVENICNNAGAVISEFPLYNKPDRFNFPRRNRIISALSLGTLVVESSLNSGSLITARYALEQNREVFAIPGDINIKTTQGCHQLIKEGATLVTDIKEVLQEIDPLYQLAGSAYKVQKINDKNSDNSALNEIQKKLLSHIDYQITSINIIIGEMNISPGEIHEHLLALELMQKIEVIPGGYRKI